MITLRHLLYFAATADHGSTAAAARALNISQPSISVAVRELELQLGEQLFVRNPAKGLALTGIGRQKLIQARRLLTGFEAFGASGRQGGGSRGIVSFGYFSTLGPSHVPKILKLTGQQLPGLEIDLTEGDLETMHQQVEQGQIELALTYDVGLGGRIKTHTVAQYPPHALLPEDHPLARKATVRLEDLAKCPFVLIDLPHSREYVLSSFRSRGIEPDVRYKPKSLEMVRGLVANGLGVSVLYTRPAIDLAYDGEPIACRPISGQTTIQKLVLAQSSEAALSEPASALADCIKNWFS